MSLVLRRGDTGEAVRALQKALVDRSLLDESDIVGRFGPKTEKAVIEFQKRSKLVPDGIVGEATLGALELIKLGGLHNRLLTDEAICNAAQKLGVEKALMLAFSEVESNGRGYLPCGKIKVLYERHIFRRQALKRGLNTLIEMMDDSPYKMFCLSKPGGYAGGVIADDRLATAASINPEVAYDSASYGRFQLMGFRHDWCGFKSSQEMYEVLNAGGEDAHLDAVVNFIIAQPELVKSMQEKDFLQMALIYNGPKQQGYDIKLSDAYLRYKELEQ